MRRGIWSVVYPLFVVGVAAYVWFSSQTLPEVVASHFDPSGQANGFMPKEGYVWFMAGLVVMLPVLVVYLPNVLMRWAPDSINLPNRQYWLAPQRREQTIESLCRGSVGLGYLLVSFLGYVHYLGC